MANESENPLDNLSPDEQQALKQLAEKRASKSVGRRDALKTGGALSIGSLIGGGSAATAIDTASADASTSDSDGDVGEPGDLVDVFADGVDATTLSTDEELNNVRVVQENGDIQTAIDAVTNSSAPRNSGMVRVVPGAIQNLNGFAEKPPYIVGAGVTLDLRGTAWNLNEDYSHLFQLRAGSTILGDGASLDNGSGAFTGHIVKIDGGDTNAVTTNNPAQVYGYPRVIGNAASSIYRLVASASGESIGECYLTAAGKNTSRLVSIANGGDWINDNEFRFRGSVSEASTVNIIDINASAGNAARNVIVGEGVQVKGGQYLVETTGSASPSQNRVVGTWADPGNLSGDHAVFTSSGGNNVYANTYVSNQSAPSPSVTFDTTAIDFVFTDGTFGMFPQDLSKQGGKFEGQWAVDDGTNTRGYGTPCVWVNGGWMPFDGKLQIASGTSSLTAGGSSDHAVIPTGEEYEVTFGINADPNADVEVEKRVAWQDANTQQVIRFVELTGAGGVDITWSVYQKGATF